MSQIAWAGWLSALMLLTLLVSNGLRHLGVPFYLTRKVAHFGAAIPIAASAFVFESIWYPLIPMLFFLLLLALGHNYDFFPGCARKGRWSELWFPVAVVAGVASFWWKDPRIAVVPGLWLALGDGITGLVRYSIHTKEKKSWWGSIACLIVCLVIAWLLVHPFWIGASGAVVATLAEKYCGDAEGAIISIDDNIAMPVSGLAVISLLYFTVL